MILPEQVFANILNRRMGDSKAELARPQAVTWTVPSDLPYFDGHFPNSPIFPAVGIIDASVALLAEATGRPGLKPRSITLAKFLSPITPGQSVTIEWKQDPDKEWTVEWKDEARTLATLRLYA